MATSKSTEFLTGTLFWAKVLGNPRPNYGGDAREWTFEFEPDERSVAILKKHKLADRLKDKHEDRGDFLVLRKTEFSKNGNENAPIRVYNEDNTAWDSTKLIGNGSKADVKVDIRDYGPGKKKGIYPVAIRVTELVEYQSAEFGAMDRIEAEAGPEKGRDVDLKDELDDDIPNF